MIVVFAGANAPLMTRADLLFTSAREGESALAHDLGFKVSNILQGIGYDHRCPETCWLSLKAPS
jgi:hypothetical protein